MSGTAILQSPVTEKIVVEQAVPEVTFESELARLSNLSSNRLTLQVLPVMLYNDHVEVEIHTGIKKHLSYASFKDIIGRSLNQIEVAPVIIGLLPPSNMFFLSQNDRTMHINCYYPGGNRDMLYGSSKMHIVTPNIIIGYSLRKESNDWIITSTHYYCTDLPISKLPKIFINELNARAGIYDLPMSNTYGGGTMCYGGNSMPARFVEGNLRGLDWYYKYLWETPFNNDLGIRAIGNKVGVQEWYQLLAKFAKDNKTFPYKDLIGWKHLDGSVTSESAISNR